MRRRGGAPRRAARAVPLSSVAPRPRRGPWNLAHGFSRGKEDQAESPRGAREHGHTFAHILVHVVFLTKQRRPFLQSANLAAVRRYRKSGATPPPSLLRG